MLGRAALFFVGLMFLLAGCSDPVQMSELEFKEGKAYLKSRPKRPYTGKMVEYFPQQGNRKPKVYRLGEYRAGLRDGTWTIFQWNGEREVINYVMGKRQGVSERYFTNDRMSWKQEFKNDRPHGQGTFFKPDGEVERNVFYDDGVQVVMPNEKLPDKRPGNVFFRDATR